MFIMYVAQIIHSVARILDSGCQGCQLFQIFRDSPAFLHLLPDYQKLSFFSQKELSYGLRVKHVYALFVWVNYSQFC